MTTIVTRAGKGSALSWTEVDANFTNLNAAKAELTGAAFTGAVSVAGALTATGTITAPVGAVGTPSYTFSGDPNTGFYWISSDVIGIATGGTERMRISNNGNVGIGAAPGARFHVRGAASDTLTHIATIDVVDATTGTDSHGLRVSVDPVANIVQLASTGANSGGFTFMTGGNERMRIESGGNVGIGTSSPGAYRLNVNGSQFTNAIFESTQNGSYIQLKSSVGSAFLSTPAADAVGFHTGASATERMRIESGGNVAIGTATATHALNVANGATAITGHSSSVSLFLATSMRHTGTSTFYIDGTSGGTAAGITFRDGSGLTTRLAIEAAGNLRPGADNTLSLGTATFRWSQLFAGTSTINTSDEREKVWRGGIQQAEREAARAIIGELGFYQWADAVAEKGDDARFHFGVRAQRVWAIMAEHGLIDPIGEDGRPGKTPYAFLCYDEWDDVYEEAPIPTDADGVADPEVVPERRLARAAGNSYGLRIDQLTLFLLAGVLPT